MQMEPPKNNSSMFEYAEWNMSNLNMLKGLE